MSQNSNENYLAASEARIKAAQALRTLGHEIVGHEVDDSVLEYIANTINNLLPEIQKAPKRSRQIIEMKKARFSQVPQDGQSVEHFPDCVVSGPANPLGIAARAWREGDQAVLRVKLGSAFEGAPGRAHGGVVAALFDDTMGFVLSILQTPAFTGRLTVSYLAPTPLNEEIEFRAWHTNIDGRKITMAGVASYQDKVIAKAEALFIAVSPERFAAIETA